VKRTPGLQPGPVLASAAGTGRAVELSAGAAPTPASRHAVPQPAQTPWQAARWVSVGESCFMSLLRTYFKGFSVFSI